MRCAGRRMPILQAFFLDWGRLITKIVRHEMQDARMPAVSCERTEERKQPAAKQAPPETAVRAEGNIGSNLQILERRRRRSQGSRAADATRMAE